MNACNHRVAANSPHRGPGAVFWLLGFLVLLAAGPAEAATYVSAPTTFTWIDPAGHTPATWSDLTQCSGGGAPTDDDITAPIPIGFTFDFGGVNYTTVRIMSNGRLQFNNNFCGYGTQNINPRTYPYKIPNTNLVRTLRVYGNDLDPAIGGSVTYATLGTAPNREFVVTFTNVPEWDASNAPGSFFNLQVILYENGDFVYQFGPSNNPSGGKAQIGWELTTGDYALIPFSSIGALNGTAIRFTRAVVPVLAYYRMDAAKWSGTPGEVIDSSGNGHNGTAVGRANTVFPGKVCRGGNIPKNNRANRFDAVDTGIDASSQIGSVGTIDFWYQDKEAWRSGDRMLFDASKAVNAQGNFFFLDLLNSGRLLFGFDDNQGNDFYIWSSRLLFGKKTWVHIAVTWDLAAGKMAIYVDGSLAKTGSTPGSSGVLAALNTLYLGDNRSRFISRGTGATGNSADGVIDEVRIYRQVLTQAQILFDRNATHPCTVLYRFTIGVGAGTASTCKPLAVTITAEDAARNVLTTYGGLVEVSDSAGHGDWSVNTASGPLTPGAADSGTATYRFAPADNGIAVLNLADVHADDLTITVHDPSAGVTATSAGVSFRDNAFVITPTDPLGTQVVAGRAHGFDAALWRKDPTTGVCAIATQYAGAKALKAWYTPDPADPPGARAPAIGGTTLPAAVPGANNLTLTFTSGQAPFMLGTTDVGKYALDLRDDTSAFAKTLTGTARTLDGASPTLTVRPFALAIVNVLAGATPNPGASTAGGAVFTGAGDPFAATVRGVLWQAADDPTNTGSPAPGANLADNPVTPSFAWSTALAATAPYQPSGGVLGTLTLGGAAPVTLAAGAYANGAATASPLAYSEVGAFTLRALAANYLDTPGVNAGGTAVVGRFIPAWFTTAVTPGCGTAFTYSGQPFTATATAYNAFGAVTRNYDGALGFAKTTTFSDAGAGTGGSLANHVLSGLDYVRGVGPDNTITYTFTNQGTPPYPLKVRATDTDGVSSAGHVEGATEIRGGRVFLQNAFGSELLALQLPLAVQYYRDATARWVANAADTCTTLTQGDFTLGHWTGALLSGDTAVTAVALSAGSGSLTLSAPGAGKVGSVDVTGNVPAWLRYDWNPTGAATDPVGRASFGVFKGPDSVIYQREWY